MFFSRAQPATRVDFVVGGVQKAGTTALHEYLKQHPNITMPYRAKELHFFDKDEYFRNEPVDYGPLHDAFRVKPGLQKVGECTPIYFFWRKSMPRIRQYNAAMKLIFVLRDPVQRAFSQWNMERLRKTNPGDFLEALAKAEKHTASIGPEQSRKLSHLERGRYARQIEYVRQFFPESQLLFLKYEWFRGEQQEALDRISGFLGVPRHLISRRVSRHHLPYHRKLTADERATALKYFEEDIPRVEQLLGWDCSDWRQ